MGKVVAGVIRLPEVTESDILVPPLNWGLRIVSIVEFYFCAFLFISLACLALVQA